MDDSLNLSMRRKMSPKTRKEPKQNEEKPNKIKNDERKGKIKSRKGKKIYIYIFE